MMMRLSNKFRQPCFIVAFVVQDRIGCLLRKDGISSDPAENMAGWKGISGTKKWIFVLYLHTCKSFLIFAPVRSTGISEQVYTHARGNIDFADIVKSVYWRFVLTLWNFANLISRRNIATIDVLGWIYVFSNSKSPSLGIYVAYQYPIFCYRMLEVYCQTI